MARYTGTSNPNDEVGRGADSTAPDKQFQVLEGRLTYGQLSNTDSVDYFELKLSGPGLYRLILSNDAANNYSAANTWSSKDIGVSLLVTDAGANPNYGFGFSFIQSGGDGSLSFVWQGQATNGLVYVEVANIFGGDVDYVLALDHTPNVISGNSMQGTSGDDTLFAIGGNDSLRGDGGNDFLIGGLGNDLIDGGPGSDTAYYGDAPSAVIVNMGTGTATGGAGSDTLQSIEEVVGSSFGDTLTGSASFDRIDGGAGDDKISAGGGDDRLIGGAGNDSIDGGDGRDIVFYSGTAGSAGFSVDQTTGELLVQVPGAGIDRLRNVELLSFNDFDVKTAIFLDKTAPAIASAVPAAGAIAVPIDANIAVTFNEPVYLGSGTIVLRNAATGEAVATYNVLNSTRIRLDGQTLVIDPAANLLGNTAYRLEFGIGTLKDDAGNVFRGSFGYGFTTAEAPPQFSISDASATEKDGKVRFTVTLSQPQAEATFVNINVDGSSTASAGADFVSRSGVVTLPAGGTTGTFEVTLIDDTDFEPTEAIYVRLSQPSVGILGNSVALGRIVDDDDPAAATHPTDPQLGLQWHLYPGIGADVLPIWADYTGRGVKVGVFDQGIDPRHSDLAPNLAVQLGRTAANPLQAGGSPTLEDDNHGTAVAGVVAAARNGQGTVGIAYEATLVSYYSPLDGSFTPQSIANAYTYALGVDVLNDSWGYAPQYYSTAPWAFQDNFRNSDFRPAANALKALADSGRGGLGTIVVQSAGNSYRFGDDTNLHNFQNSRYIVTVGATDFVGNATAYSSPGASVLIAAPGGGGGDRYSDILTTDRSGQDGYDPGDTTTITGTSFSAPVVSGVVALILQANPHLGWRDVQQILAYSARQTATARNTWLENGATNFNGGGLHYDAVTHDLGFGLVDAWAAVRLAETWGLNALTSANLVEASATRSQSAAIPDGGGSLTQTVSITRDVEIERVEVTVDIAHEYIGDLSLMLRSPQGTESWLLSRPGVNDRLPYGTSQNDINFTFTTVLSMGESSAGTWSLSVFDAATPDAGTLRSWTLNVIGKSASADDTYIYTNEFAALANVDASRATLSDSGGRDTLNAAAVSAASRIDLVSGHSSTINGRNLLIAFGTQIEDAYAGDGDDELIGNAVVNRLFGMRGKDTFSGGAGDDQLDGGAGIDTARYDGNRSDYTVSARNGSWTANDKRGIDGNDSLVAIERLLFANTGLALDTGVQGHAGQAAQILRGVFGSASLAVPQFVGIALGLLDSGMPYQTLVGLAVETDAFTALAGSRSSADFIRLIYRNVVGVSPTAAEVSAFAGLIDSGQFSKAALATLVCQHDLNALSAELVGLAATGIEFTPG